MPSKLRAPAHSGELGIVIQKVYDDLNTVIENINTDLEGVREPDEKTKSGGLAVVKEGNKYSIRGKTIDGWAKTSMTLLDDTSIKTISNTLKFGDSANISADINSLTDGSTGTASDTLVEITGSYVQATIENTVASLAGKINELITKTNDLIVIVNTHNSRINTLIDNVNKLLKGG